jgi:erythromycin esterase
VTDDIARLATPLESPRDLDPLLERVGDARCVLLGEASHGTADYYGWRAALTRRLIAERGFTFVAVEGDWPDCWQVNCYVRGASSVGSAREVLHGYERWPTWMWANTEVAEFAEWLRSCNDARAPGERVGFYGLDVYSLWESMDAILGYLREHEPNAVEAAQRAFRCFEPYGEDPQEYAWATRLAPTSCEDAVVALLREVRDEATRHPGEDPEGHLNAEQNAEVAAGAERYYRAMVRGGAESWNVRDVHMADTLDRLLRHHGPDAKAVVWEHNTHIGDARATDMAADGMVNVGQLVRERHGRDRVVLVGFGGHRGSVIAGAHWGAPMERMRVPPARAGSVEDLLESALGGERALFVFPPAAEQPRWLTETHPHRAIGVVYDPARERWGNYVPTVLGDRYDAFCSFSETTALHPLHLRDAGDAREPETYPWTV